MYIIQREDLEGSSYHPVQYQSHRKECWEESYIAVPKNLEERVVKSGGYCHLLIQEDTLLDIEEWKPPELLPPATAIEGLEELLLEQEYRLILLEWGVV